MTELGSDDITTRLSGRYAVQRLLGRGGMGAVHLARDLQLDRLVAIKDLPAEFASDPILRERFLREVRMAASFSHPNIVPVYAVEEQGASLAFVMGYVEGESLTERVRRAGPLSSRETLRLLLDVAYALAYAHGRGVVHRDIKPDNIMLERATGRAQLMDFGVARTIDSSPTVAGMTRVGEVVGTPEYMSPEQATGEMLDGRSDLYSLGLVGYFAVTGEVAFGGDSAARILVRQLTEALPPITSVRGDLPAALASVIDRCLAKERDERFDDATAMIAALDAAQAAAPEVPVAIRLFAHEAETLGMVTGFFSLVTLFLLTNRDISVGILDRMIPVVVVCAVLFGRYLQTRSEARRLVQQGFSVDFVLKGLRSTVDEREERRAQLRLDADVVRRRRRTVVSGLAMLLGAAALVFFAVKSRVGVPGNYRTPLAGAFMLFSGLGMLGLGIVLLVRSPLRMGVWERLFRLLWLGPLGRWFFPAAEPSASLTMRTSLAVARAPSASRAPSPQHEYAIKVGASSNVARSDVSQPNDAQFDVARSSDARSSDARIASLEARMARVEERLGDP